MSVPRLRWALWLIALTVYTYLLVVPNDWLPPWLQHTVSKQITNEFTFGKLAHILSYAFLTATTFLLPVGWRVWGICVAVMSLHGFGTEYVQTFTGRHGCWFDVGIDHIGVGTGLLLGGLGYWLFGGRSVGGGMDRVAAPPQVQSDAGRDD
jgi:VanZ family protein